MDDAAHCLTAWATTRRHNSNSANALFFGYTAWMPFCLFDLHQVEQYREGTMHGFDEPQHQDQSTQN
jgi:hypothetical protein